MTQSNSDAPIAGEGNAPSDPAELRLRGDALDDAAQKSTVDHARYREARNPDAELRLDGEDDSLYNDGLDVRDLTDSYAGTDGDAPKGIKG
jgi:hypothetical protein